MDRGRDDRRRRALMRLGPFVYAVAVFAAVLGNRFWLDDYGWVGNAVRATVDPSVLLETTAGFFRPVVAVVFLGNYLISRLHPAGYYAVNILLHLINVALVFGLSRRLFRGSYAVAGLASLLFAGAVGNYGEAVIWISGRTELVATAFSLGALLAYWSFLHGHGGTRYLLTLACFALALLSKESAVTLLPALFLLDWLGTRKRLREMFSADRLRLYAPMVLLLLPYLWFERVIQQRNYVVAEQHYGIGWHVAPNVVEYLALMVLPITPESTVIGVSSTLGALLGFAQVVLGLGLFGGVVAVLLSRAPGELKFAVAWMIVAIVPYALFTWKTTTRYLYTPSIGFVMAVAFLAVLVLARVREHPRLRRPVPLAMGGALVIVLMVQWLIVNMLIQQWRGDQVHQSPAAYQELVQLARSLDH